MKGNYYFIQIKIVLYIINYSFKYLKALNVTQVHIKYYI